MKNLNKIFIVDDHKIFREGLEYVISQMEGFKLVGEAPDGKAFLEMLDDLDIDIVLMDIYMPGIDGIEATIKALQKKPNLKIVALTMFCDEGYLHKMIQAGVYGYILKESGKKELTTALKAVAAGENYFSQKLLGNILVNLGNNKTFNVSQKHLEIKLTVRELEVLKLICQGMTNTEISDKLCVSPRTVEGHKASLISKTGSKNSVSLVMFAMKNNLVEL
jgi:DNA-binding NarL/FixJ family response regulator